MPVLLYGEVGNGARPVAFRRGGLDELVRRIAAGEVTPDFGPHEVDPRTGVVLVGARRPLVAYNVELETDDLAVAQAVAAAVRESSGGLPGVQAIGLELPRSGRIQVSMNIVDIERTPLHEAVAAVAREARARGVEPGAGELVGLVPAAVLTRGGEGRRPAGRRRRDARPRAAGRALDSGRPCPGRSSSPATTWRSTTSGTWRSTGPRRGSPSPRGSGCARRASSSSRSAGEHTYGVNTGFGRFVSAHIPEELADELQLRLLRSHACGVGDAVSRRGRAGGDAAARERAREGLLRGARRARGVAARVPEPRRPARRAVARLRRRERRPRAARAPRAAARRRGPGDRRG